MKFPRNARIFRGQLDAAPFAIVFFLLIIFVMLGSMVYTPGVRLNLPVAEDLPGTDKPTIAVAMDASGRLYFDNQLIDEPRLKLKLRQAAAEKPGLTLLLQMDQSAQGGKLVHLMMLAREAGINESVLATLPRPLAGSP